LPDDPQLTRLAEQNTTHVSVTSSPASATVEIQDYLSPDGDWYRLGATPLTSVQIPTGYFRWKVLKAGIGESVAAPTTEKNMQFALDSTVAAPQGMSWVGGGSWSDMIAFVGWVGPYNVPPYYIDRLEVTNRQYQEFVDKGGYEKQEYWPKQFLRDGRELTWQDAKSQFRDTTGRTGPSTWAGGHYPEGQGDIQCRELAGTRPLPTRRSRARACPRLFRERARVGPKRHHCRHLFHTRRNLEVSDLSLLQPGGALRLGSLAHKWCPVRPEHNASTREFDDSHQDLRARLLQG